MSNQPSNQRVQCRIDARGVAFVTLNRPDQHNAFDDQMIAQLRQHFEELAQRDDVRVLVLESTGKSFSAGADLAWMQRMANFSYADNLHDARQLALMLSALKNLPQPSIARVQGNALGGAVGLVSCCDIAIGSSAAVFGLTETRIGLIPATIGPYVVEAIGARWARRLFLTAERFDALQAERIGLIHECCKADQLNATIEALLEVILRNGPRALREAKQLVSDIAGRHIDSEMLEDTSARIARVRVSAEGQAGLTAFLGKQNPYWLAGSDD
jgi:methylglutaconyl-CoA hydratase